MDERQDAPGLYSRMEEESQLYDDRADAGASLSNHLLHYKQRDALVLGVARGGVPVAREVASRLGADLDVMVARKIGAPFQKELALGAVTADGTRSLNQPLITSLGVPDDYLERTTAEQRAEAAALEQKLRAGLPAISTQGRTVILVDDGLATGATVRACVAALRKAGAHKVVVAVPVGSTSACRALEAEVDELVCPRQPEPFFAVGAHYQAFMQTSDREVLRLLRDQRERRDRSGPSAQPSSGR